MRWMWLRLQSKALRGQQRATDGPLENEGGSASHPLLTTVRQP